VQEAGRAGRDGKPARCVLLNQPDDLAIQEHFLKEAHPTKTQARMVAEGLYAWSDEGKEVSVRDLALSMALPERRVRVILSVLEAMGVAEEVKAARWKGVEPKPTREQIDKAASVFEARRISDRRRLDSLLKYMNTQKCRVQMLRSYFGEPEGEKCGLCDSDAGLDSEVFDSGDADERHGLHAATDFHARPRRRRRGRGAGYEAPMAASAPVAPPQPRFETQIPADVLPPLPPFEVPAPAESEQTFDDGLWAVADAGAGEPMSGDAVVDLSEHQVEPGEAAVDDTAPAGDQDFVTGWAAVRDANIRPYAEWRPGAPIVLPVLTARPQAPGASNGGHHGHGHGHGHGGGGGGGGGGDRHFRGGGPGGRFDGDGGGGNGGRRRRRRGKNRDNNSNSGNNNRRDHHRHRDRDRGPRLPGVYNPGGD
jgi:hypothetical protein